MLAMDNPIEGVTVTLLETSFGESLRDAHAVWGMSEFMPATTHRGAGRWVSEGVWADSSGIGRAWLASYQGPRRLECDGVLSDPICASAHLHCWLFGSHHPGQGPRSSAP